MDSLGFLSKYRLYFMVPMFAVALLCLPKTQKWAFYTAVFEAVIALIISFGLGFGRWKKCINERRYNRTLGQQQQPSYKNHYSNNWCEPKFLSIPEE